MNNNGTATFYLPLHWRGTYSQVASTLGQPRAVIDPDKSHVGWDVRTPHGWAEVYDYGPIHECHPECGGDPRNNAVVVWHINGRVAAACRWVRDRLEAAWGRQW